MNGLLVTGFGPFGAVEANPASKLAESCGERHLILEVAYRGVDEVLANLDPASFDKLLLIGVAAGAEKIQIETVARNVIGETPDVRGEVHGPGPIAPDGPGQLGTTLWRHPELMQETEVRRPSVDAGSYLCNYVYYRALERFTEKQVGFLHVPSFEKMAFDRQLEVLREVIGLLAEG